MQWLALEASVSDQRKLFKGDYNAKDGSNHSRRVADCRVDSSARRRSPTPTHKSDRARVHATEQFRKANDSVISPSVEQQDLSDYSEGHVISAPAGR